MGIRGLTSYMEWYYSKKRMWRSIQVRGKLVLDAMSICFCIHEKYQIDWSHGGQYWELRQYFMGFIDSLLMSGIEPIVIFDGIDFTGNKSSEMMKRKKGARRFILNIIDNAGGKPAQTSTAPSASPATQAPASSAPAANSDVIPLFTEMVFSETLKEKGVQFVYADGDADSVIASIANYYSCPVVSNDSDFFLFNIKGGYIPFDNLNWEDQPVTAQVYDYIDFVSSFQFQTLDLPLLIPAIMGNDCIRKVKSPCLRGDIAVSLLQFRDRRGGTRSRRDKTHELVHYLSKFMSFDHFLTHVSSCCQNDELSAIKKNFEKAKEFYTIEAISMDDLMSKTKLTTANGTPVLDWMHNQFRKGAFSTCIMSPMAKNVIVLFNAIDNPRRRSAMFVSLHIRSCIYQIMTPYLEQSFLPETVCVDSHNGQNHVVYVLDDKTPGLLSVTNMAEQSTSCRLKALCMSLECSPDILEWFEDKWKLVVLSLGFWAKRVVPDIHLIKSLVLCFVVCSSDKDPSLLISTDCDKQPHNNDTLHVFSMWQCVYFDAMKLNNLLMNPLLFTSPALLFDGRLAMHYASLTLTDLDNTARRVLTSLQSLALFQSLVSVCNESIKMATMTGIQYDQTVYYNFSNKDGSPRIADDGNEYLFYIVHAPTYI